MPNNLQALLIQARKNKQKKRGRKAKSRPIYVSKRIEVAYAKALLTLVDDIHKQTLNEFNRVNIGDSLSNIAVADGLLDILKQILAKLKLLFSSKYQQVSEQLATKIVTMQAKYADSQLAKLFKKQTGLDLSAVMTDEAIEEAVKEAIHANVSLIKSIPDEYLQRVEKAVMAGLQSGQLSTTLAEELQKIKKITDNRAKLIANDQLGKINGRITQIRQQNLGITHYEWSTCHDERVRHSHRLRDGKIFAWDKPPSDGHAGMAIRCRCVAIAYFGDDGDERIKEQEKSRNNLEQAQPHLLQSERLLKSKFASNGLSASEFLVLSQAKKQGNPALRLSWDLYQQLVEKLGSVPKVWGVNHYTIHSLHINNLLRQKEVVDEFLEPSKIAIAMLDKLFAHEKAIVKEPFKVWRGHSFYPKDFEDIEKALNNDKIVKLPQITYLSTSLDEKLAENFAQRNAKGERIPIIYHLNLQNNAKAIDISSYHFYIGDNEILLHRNSVLEIKSMKKRDDDVYEIEADVLPSEKNNIGDDNESKPKRKIIHAKGVEDPDPYWYRWGGGDCTIIIDG